MKAEELPLVLTVKEAASVMRIGITKMYETARRRDFPKLQEGRKIIIPRDAFLEWLHSQANKKTA